MNTRYNMIIIKGEIKTPDIISCMYNSYTKKRMLNLIMEKSCGFAMLYVTQSLYYVCCRSKAEKWRYV